MADSKNPGQWTPGTFKGVINVTLQLTPASKAGAAGPAVMAAVLPDRSRMVRISVEGALLAPQPFSHYSSHMLYLCRL